MLNLNDIISVLETQKSEAERKAASLTKILNSFNKNADKIKDVCNSFITRHKDSLLELSSNTIVTDSVIEDIDREINGDYFRTISQLYNIVSDDVDYNEYTLVAGLLDSLLSYTICNIR